MMFGVFKRGPGGNAAIQFIDNTSIIEGCMGEQIGCITELFVVGYSVKLELVVKSKFHLRLA